MVTEGNERDAQFNGKGRRENVNTKCERCPRKTTFELRSSVGKQRPKGRKRTAKVILSSFCVNYLVCDEVTKSCLHKMRILQRDIVLCLLLHAVNDYKFSIAKKRIRALQ